MILILCTFAIGGSACARLAKWVLDLIEKERGDFWWWALYFVIVTLLWPLCVMLVSIPFGQYRFFKNYLHRMGGRMFGRAPRSEGQQESTPLPRERSTAKQTEA